MERKNITIDAEMLERIYALRNKERYRKMSFSGIVRELLTQALVQHERITDEGRESAYIAMDHAAKMLEHGAGEILAKEIRDLPNTWRHAFSVASWIIESCGITVTQLDESSEVREEGEDGCSNNCCSEIHQGKGNRGVGNH